MQTFKLFLNKHETRNYQMYWLPSQKVEFENGTVTISNEHPWLVQSRILVINGRIMDSKTIAIFRVKNVK